MVSDYCRWTVSGVLMVLVAASGCGGTDDAEDVGDTTEEDTTDVQGGGDADASEPDQETGVEPDVEGDADDDTSEDTGPDAVDDVEADSADVEPDTTPDAVTDVADDVSDASDSSDVADAEDDADVLDIVEDVAPDVEPDVSFLCEGVVCSQPSNPCRVSTCNPGTGLCESEPLENGTTCGSASSCRGGAVCQEGECTAFEVVPNGTECVPESDFACSLSPACRDGFCAADVYGCMPDGFELLDVYDASTGEPWVPDTTGVEIFCPDRTLLKAVEFSYGSGFASGVAGNCAFPEVIDTEFVPSIVEGLDLRFSSGGGTPDSSDASVTDCPAGQLIVGISWLPSAITGDISAVRVVCAPYTLVDERPEGFSFELGAPIEPVYDAAVADSVQTLRCGEGDIVQGAGIASSGASLVRLACTRPEMFLARSGPGSPSSRRFDDRVIMCPLGSALVGFGAENALGFYDGFTTSATAICRELAPDFSGESSQLSWGEQLIANQLPLGILRGSGDATVTCPENTWVYAATFSGLPSFADTSLLTGAVLNCAPIFTLPAVEFGEQLFFIDTIESTTVTFGTPGTTGTLFNECPDGQSVVGIWSFSGEVWDSAALMCSSRYPIAIVVTD
jgi:hypothetical protein